MAYNNIPPKGSSDYADYVINLAKGPTMLKGVVNEPRVFFDVITVDGNGLESFGTPGAFINGEQFPIRMTHMLASMRYLDQDDAVSDQLTIQRMGLRLQYHDQFYMNPTFLPLPVWGNKVVAASDTVSFGTSGWDFVQNGRPFVLSARDTLQVEAQLNDATDPESGSEVPLTVTFTGFGMLSKRVYMLSSQVNLSKAGIYITMPTADFRNDGIEPIAITDMTVNVAGALDDEDPRGDINRVSINVRQAGNGTNARWFAGPTAVSQCQASLLGVTSGRAVVHELPGDGLIWQPNDGITVSAQQLGTSDMKGVLCLAFAGYIMVT